MEFKISQKTCNQDECYISRARDLIKEKSYFIEEENKSYIIFFRKDRTLKKSTYENRVLYMAENGRVEVFKEKTNYTLVLTYHIVLLFPLLCVIFAILITIFGPIEFALFTFLSVLQLAIIIINVRSEMRSLFVRILNNQVSKPIKINQK